MNKQRKFRPRLFDLNAFNEVAGLLTHHALDSLMTEWSITKSTGLAIEKGEEKAFEFDLGHPICTLACKLLIRNSLPYRHWMYPDSERDCQMPLSISHPRWFFDRPPVLHERWRM